MNQAYYHLPYALTIGILCGSIIACGGGNDGSNRNIETSIITGDELDPAKWQFINNVKQRENDEWVSEVSSRGINDQSELAFQDFTNPFKGLSFQADVTVKQAKNIGTLARAFIQGRFYKAFAAPERAGEIIANIDIRQEPNSQELIFGAFVVRCEDLNCDTTEPPLFTEELGTATLGEPHTLSITFDGERTFAFKVDNQAPVTFEGPPVVEGIRHPLRILGTSISGVDPESEPVEEGVIKASFDNVLINGAPREDFNADTKLTQQDALVRRVSNGVLELARSIIGEADDGSRDKQGADALLQPIDALAITNSIQADVVINQTKTQGTDVEESVGLVNGWYQTDSGPVSSTIALTGKNQIEIQVLGNGGELNEQQFFPIDTSTMHNLSMDFDGNFLNFNVDAGSLFQFNVTERAPIVNARPLTVVSTGVYVVIEGLGRNDDIGSISANVDNVVINGELYDDFSTLTQSP